MRTRGQAIVEFALVAPILFFTLLAFGELGRAFAVAHIWQRSADVLADSAAVRIATQPGESWRSGWEALVRDEQARSTCDDPDVTYPDGTNQPGDRVQVGWTCQYQFLLFNGVTFPPTRIESVAVIPLAP